MNTSSVTDRTVDLAADGDGAASRHRRPLRTEAWKGSWGVLITVAMVCPSLIQLLNTRDYIAVSWVWTHDALRGQGLLFGGSLAVAVGCWHGGRDRRRRVDELLSSMPVSPLRRTALAATPAVLWPVVSYLLTAAVCLVTTWTVLDVLPGRPFVTLLAADAVAIGSLGLLGFVAGRAIALPLAAPALGVVTGICITMLADGLLPGLTFSQSGLRALSPAAEHETAWEVPVWWLGPVSMLWFGGPAVAALLAQNALRRAALVPLAVALASGAVLVGAEGGLWVTDRDATALVCDKGGSPQVCTVRSHRAYLSAGADLLTGVRSKLGRIPNVPGRLVEIPQAENGRPSVAALGKGDVVLDQPVFDFDDPPGSYRLEAAYKIVLHGCTKSRTDGTTRVPGKYSDAVATWLTPSDGRVVSGAAGRVLKRIEAMPERERTAWLGDYFAAVRDCRPERIKGP